MKRILGVHFILGDGRKREAILVLFVPLHGRCQYNVVTRSHSMAHLDKLAEVSDILEAQILRKVQAVLLDRVYTACSIGGLVRELDNMKNY